MLVHSSTMSVSAGQRATSRLRGADDLTLRIVDVERRQVLDQRALERAAGRDAFDGRVGRAPQRAGDRPERRASTVTTPACASSVEQQQARGPHRHRQRGLQLALEQHEEAAARRDRGRAVAHQAMRRVEERLQQRRVAFADHALRRRARDDACSAPGRRRSPDGRCRRARAGSACRASARRASSRRLHSDVAARAAWSYMPDIVRSSRAISPMSGLRSASRLSTRQVSRTSRYFCTAASPAGVGL